MKNEVWRPKPSCNRCFFLLVIFSHEKPKPFVLHTFPTIPFMILSSCTKLTFSVLVIPKPLHLTHLISHHPRVLHYSTALPSPMSCHGLSECVFLVVSFLWRSTVTGRETCSYKTPVSRDCTTSPQCHRWELSTVREEEFFIALLAIWMACVRASVCVCVCVCVCTRRNEKKRCKINIISSSPSAPAHFFFVKDDFRTRIALVFVRSKKIQLVCRAFVILK